MILVTGANGLVGSQVCKLLIENSILFKALKRTDSDISLCEGLNIEWLDGDVTDILAIEKSLKGVETVIHCAAVVSFNEKDKDLMMNINVNGTRNLINSSLEEGVKQFIHVSSIAALGRSKDNAEITENAQWVDSTLNTNYAESKYLSELEVWRGQCEGLEVAIVNPSVIIAAGDGVRSSSKLLQYVWEEHKFYIDRHVSFVDVRDVAQGILQIYKKGIWGQRFILNQGYMKYNELFGCLATFLSKKPPKWNVSLRFVKVGVMWSRFFSIITRKDPLVSNELMKSMRGDFSYSNEKFRKELNFEFKKPQETLEWACLEFIKVKSAS